MFIGVSHLETTKETIRFALLELLNTNNFKDLTVKEIAYAANISRSTFYLYYVDKYDLMDDVRRLLNDRFLSFYQSQHPGWEQPMILHLCQHFVKYRSFYNVEFNDANAIQNLSDRLTTQLMLIFDDQDYAIFASYGTIGYLSRWLKDSFVISPYEAAEKLLKIGFTNWSKEIATYDIYVAGMLK